MARDPQGTFLGIPYNWTRPSRQDLTRAVWDPQDERVLTPRTWGWGYGINFHAIGQRLRKR